MKRARFWKVVFALTGGRPMHIVQFCFTDVVVNRPVYLCVDWFGRSWMAHGRWSLFRVSANRTVLPSSRGVWL